MAHFPQDALNLDGGQGPRERRLPILDLGLEQISQLGHHVGALALGKLAAYGGEVTLHQVHHRISFRMASTDWLSARHSATRRKRMSEPSGERR